MAPVKEPEDVKIGGLNMGRNPLMIVLVVVLCIGIPVGGFFLRYQSQAQKNSDRNAAEIEEATARTLLVEGINRDVKTMQAQLVIDEAKIDDLIARMTKIESFAADTEGRLGRAESSISENTDGQKQQRQRALVREGDRKVRDSRISDNARRIAEIDVKLANGAALETAEYRASTKRLQLERQELLLENQALRRDLGDARKALPQIK